MKNKIGHMNKTMKNQIKETKNLKIEIENLTE
jgi:hypothetical protein